MSDMTCYEKTLNIEVGAELNLDDWCENCLKLHDAMYGNYPEGVDGSTLIKDAKVLYPCTKTEETK